MPESRWKTWHKVVFGTCVLLSLGICVLPKEPSEKTASREAPAPSSAPEKATPKPERLPAQSDDQEDFLDCTSPHPRFVDQYIASALNGRRLGPAFVAQSEAYPGGPGAPVFASNEVWFLSGDIGGKGIGLWATTTDPTRPPSGAIVIVAANDVAEAVTKMGVDLPRESRPSAGDLAATEAFSCALQAEN
ncbi:MAG TPA: hypothetical protein VG318_07910 [Actinomycetota bacterium]|nr:hypothetical protein [Actinomycetota bacterium]